MKARTDGSRPCRYGTSAVSVASPAIQSGSTRRNAPISHHHDKRSQAGHYAKAGNRSLLGDSMSFQRDGSLAVRRTRAMSTDGWQFSGDAVRFAGRTAAAVHGARKALSAEVKSEAQRRS